MDALSLTLLILYILPILFIAMYSIAQLELLTKYVKQKKEGQELVPELKEYPIVTVQLPIYNELYVIERLIDRACEFDYPKDKLEIQVLDDSTDETVDIVSNKVRFYKEKGFDIQHIRREDRKGYKAGALHEATQYAKGEFLAIFDADFLPRKDFLLETIPHFQSDNIGVVQTRWVHLNQDYSLLTKAQAFALDAHFSIEQTGRNSANHFINFNGTAGVWRKSCIHDTGGWQADTLTEDLDLSYRAQLNGWKFKYLEDLESPAELPITMTAIKSQQFRWTKGAAEVSKKLLWKVLKSDLPFATKFHAFFHLLNSSVYIPIFLVGILSIPVLLVKNQNPILNDIFKYAGFLLISLVILGVSYYVSLMQDKRLNKFKTSLKFLYLFPSFLAFSMGLSLHNMIAVLEAYFGKKSAFIRTPKFNIEKLSGTYKGNKYSIKKLSPLLLIEFLLALYFAYGLYKAFVFTDFSLFHFHLLLFVGYSSVVYYTIKHAKLA